MSLQDSKYWIDVAKHIWTGDAAGESGNLSATTCLLVKLSEHRKQSFGLRREIQFENGAIGGKIVKSVDFAVLRDYAQRNTASVAGSDHTSNQTR